MINANMHSKAAHDPTLMISKNVVTTYNTQAFYCCAIGIAFYPSLNRWYQLTHLIFWGFLGWQSTPNAFRWENSCIVGNVALWVNWLTNLTLTHMVEVIVWKGMSLFIVSVPNCWDYISDGNNPHIIQLWGTSSGGKREHMQYGTSVKISVKLMFQPSPNCLGKGAIKKQAIKGF